MSADSFELDDGSGLVTVEMDDGDRVSVTGDMDTDFFEIEGCRELIAKTIVTLYDADEK